MTELEELIKAGFHRHLPKDILANHIYWKREDDRVQIYSMTDSGELVKTYDGSVKYVHDKINDWENEIRRKWG